MEHQIIKMRHDVTWLLRVQLLSNEGKDLEKDYLELLRLVITESRQTDEYISVACLQLRHYIYRNADHSIKTLHMESLDAYNNTVFAFMIIISGYLCFLTDFQCCKARSYHYWWIGWLSQFVGICLFWRSLFTNPVFDGRKPGIGTPTDLVNILLELATNKDRFKLGQLTSSSICSICLGSMETQSDRGYFHRYWGQENLYQISAYSMQSVYSITIIGKWVEAYLIRKISFVILCPFTSQTENTKDLWQCDILQTDLKNKDRKGDRCFRRNRPTIKILRKSFFSAK